MANSAYYEKNRDAIIARVLAWQKNNPDKYRAKQNKWYGENRERHKQIQDKYRKANPARYLLMLAKRRSKARGIPFDIDVSDIVVPAECPLLGIPLNSYSKDMDFRPSLDRRNPSLGYVKGNVMVVSWKANRLKNNSSGDELLTLALNILRAEGKLP